MRILLTGGSGFIGRNIRESYLAEKYEITAPSHAELDLTDDEATHRYLASGRFDVIIHAAGKAGHRAAKDPTSVFHANARMFFDLARETDYFAKMIVTGSGSVYDMRHYQPCMREEYFGEHIPADEHGFSRYVMARYMEGKSQFVDLRIFGIFGKHEEYSIRFISNMICKALFDLPLTMKQNRRFSYLWVEDFLPILERFIEGESRRQSYNVTPDEPRELYAIAELVRQISGKNLPIVSAADGYGADYTGDNAALRSEFPALAFTPFEQSVEALYRWYHSNLASVDRTLLLADR